MPQSPRNLINAEASLCVFGHRHLSMFHSPDGKNDRQRLATDKGAAPAVLEQAEEN
jgi:hypothetical protein